MDGTPVRRSFEDRFGPKSPRDSGRREVRNGRHSDNGISGARAALSLDDPFERLSSFLSILSSYGPDEILLAKEAFDELRGTGIHLPLEERFLHLQIGRLRGGDTMPAWNDTGWDAHEFELLKARVEGWAQMDRAAAAQWIDSLPPGKQRDQMMLAITPTVARENPAEALRLVGLLHPSQHEEAGRMSAHRLSETGSATEVLASLEAMKAAAGGDGTRYLEALFDELLTGAGAIDGEMAAEFVERNLDQTFIRPVSLAKVSSDIAGDDPVAALEWSTRVENGIPSLPPGSVMAAAVGGMNLHQLEEAEKWSEGRYELPGVAVLLAEVHRVRRILEDRGGDDYLYDPHD